MARFAASLLSSAALCLAISTPILTADPPAKSDPIANTLALQQAMQKARYCLQHGNDAQKAVDLLEAQLPRVSGNTEYLSLLREAYRANIQRLYLASQPAKAQTYLERLCVLEPAAANDPTLRPAPDTPLKIEPIAKAPEKKPASIFPDFGKLAFLKAKPPVVRAVPEDTAVTEDPFDAQHQREAAPANEKRTAARQLVAKGDAEFKQAHYPQARSFYEQAYQLEADSLAKSKSREAWAYCVFSHVVEQLNQTTVPSQALPDLRKQVQTAIAMAPEQNSTGQWLIAQIDERQRTVAVAAPAHVAGMGLKHLGRNPEGWFVSETANFRIFHKQNNDFAERVAQTAERTRSDMSRKWFGNESTAWQPKCELIIHPTGKDYAQMTGVSMASPGHSRIESDKTNAARVIARRMDMRMDTQGMMDGVLPHETTHVVLAGNFGPFPVPRWADEGIAVLTEPAAKIEQHRQNLLRAHQDGLLFGLKELMTMPDYPEPRRIGAFYAQSVILCEFLTSQKGPTVLTSFVRDGLREGYEAALQKHYGMNFAQLQQAWNQQVLGSQKIAAGN